MAEQNQKINYHSHDQRKHYRLTTPFWVQSEGKTYKTKDWSVGGLSLANYHRSVNYGETLNLKIIIKFQGFNIGFEAQAKVVAIDNGNNLRCEFYNLSDRSKNILKFFSQSIISGQMVDVEDTIKRIDVPINMQQDNIDAVRGNKAPINRWPLKSLFFTILYLTLGLLLFLYLGLVLYSNFKHLKVESAVVSAPVEKIVSPFESIIGEYYINIGQVVKEGQPIVRLIDHEIEHKLELEKTELLRALNDHGLKKKFLEGESNKIAIYENIGKTKLHEAQASVDEVTEKLEQVKNDHERHKSLYAKGHISKAIMDKAEADYETVLHQFNQAKHQLAVHEKSLDSINQGHYFSVDKIEGDLPQHKANVAHAENQIDIIKQRIKAHEDQISRRIIRAPFDGHITGLSKSVRNTVAKGDELFLLERNEKRSITAFLTQDEVVEVSLNSKASVYVPLLNKTYAAKVTHVDRTDGFVDEVNAKYRPRTIKDRSAKVELELLDFKVTDARKQLRPGSPAIVYFDRSLTSSLMHRIKLYFSPAHDTPANSKDINTEFNKRLNNNKVKNIENEVNVKNIDDI